MSVEINHSGTRTLVTGAGAGIGKEIALWMARAGSDIAILDKQVEHAQAVAKEVEGLGVKAVAVCGDARDDDKLISMIDETVEKMGGLDFAINNIGMLGVEGTAKWLDITAAQIRDAVEQNLTLTAIACQTEASHMVANKTKGVILNVGSGETTRPALGLAAYGAAKAGINHLTQTLATELGEHGIRVNAIAPGTTFTKSVEETLGEEKYQVLVKSTPLQMETLPEELGRLAVFLTSDLARCITGQLILADAGAHLSRNRPSI